MDILQLHTATENDVMITNPATVGPDGSVSAHSKRQRQSVDRKMPRLSMNSRSNNQYAASLNTAAVNHQTGFSVGSEFDLNP